MVPVIPGAAGKLSQWLHGWRIVFGEALLGGYLDFPVDLYDLIKHCPLACGSCSCAGNWVIERDSDVAIFSGCQNASINNMYIFAISTSVQGFKGVTSISGDLTISSSMLMSLKGLEGLTNIAGNLIIHNSDALTSLEGLDSLRTVGGSVRIERSRM